MSLVTTYCSHCFTRNRLPGDKVDASAKCGRCHQPLFSHSPVSGRLAHFDALIQSDIPVVVDFWASWCGPCRMLSPIVDEVAEERTDVKVGKVNVDEQPDLAAQFGVMSIPTLLVFEQGKLVRQAVGARPKAGVLELLG